MSEFLTFLDMGGYAAYVWTSFGVAMIVLLANVLWSRSQLIKQKQRAIKLAETRRQV
ncbi:MAG: heme exporter protein CcmD [Granulosicoccaceae bacterium]